MNITAFEKTRLLGHPLVAKAFALAEKGHEGQVRGTSAGRERAYINHPVRVAEILQDCIDDYDPALIAAALAHDLLEDTDVTEREIGETLGHEVLALVREVSVDDSTLRGAARRSFQIEKIESAGIDARRLKVADRLANLISMAFDPPEKWTVVNRFNYLQSSREMIEKADIRDPRLQIMIKDVLEVAERSVFVAVRERVREKGAAATHWKGADANIDVYIQRALADIELEAELFDQEGKPLQRHDSLDKLYGEAALAQRELANVAGLLSKWMKGVEAVIPDTLKGRERAEEVVRSRCKGDPRGISDLARVAIVCETLEQARYAVHAISQSYKIAELSDNIAKPPMTAYRDIHLVTRSDRSHFCEIQIHLRHLWDAKCYRGDDIYREIRRICVKDTLEPEERRAKQKLFDESRALYKAAAERHGLTDHKPAKDRTPLRPTGMKLPPEVIGEDVIMQEKLHAAGDFPELKAG